MKPAKTTPEEVVLAPELPVGESEITDAEVNEAARQLGLTFFSASKARLLKKIGAFQVQTGVIQLGVGRLAATDEALHRLLEVSVAIAEDATIEGKQRTDALSAGKGLIDSMHRSIELMADLQLKKLIASASAKKRSFVDEQPIVPIQAQSGSTVVVNVDKTPDNPQTT